MKNLLVITLLFSSFGFTDGPSYPEPELSEKHLEECSDGIIKRWKYDPSGFIFYGKNLDRECSKNLRGIPPNRDSDKNFLFNGNEFWFFTTTDSYGSEVSRKDDLVITRHFETRYSQAHVIKGVFTAKSQDDIESISLINGGNRLYEDYYLSYYTKSYRAERGGAFWYNSKRNYLNEIIELIDLKEPTKIGYSCVTPEEAFTNYPITKEELQEHINPETGLSTWWLASLTYHKRPEWCFSQ